MAATVTIELNQNLFEMLSTKINIRAIPILDKERLIALLMY